MICCHQCRDLVKNQGKVDDVRSEIYCSRYPTKKKKTSLINICVKYCLLTPFDTCYGGSGIAQFQLSFLGLEEPRCYHRHLPRSPLCHQAYQEIHHDQVTFILVCKATHRWCRITSSDRGSTSSIINLKNSSPESTWRENVDVRFLECQYTLTLVGSLKFQILRTSSWMRAMQSTNRYP